MEPLKFTPTFMGLPPDLAKGRFYSNPDLYNRLCRLCRTTYSRCKEKEVIQKISNTEISLPEIRSVITDELPHIDRVLIHLPFNNDDYGAVMIDILPPLETIDFIGPYPENVIFISRLSLFDAERIGEYYSIPGAINEAFELGYRVPSFDIQYLIYQRRNLPIPDYHLQRVMENFRRGVEIRKKYIMDHPAMENRGRFSPLYRYLIYAVEMTKTSLDFINTHRNEFIGPLSSTRRDFSVLMREFEEMILTVEKVLRTELPKVGSGGRRPWDIN